MEEEREWKDIDRDCMVEILSRVGVDTLVLSIPKVCKSWYIATLDPVCWRNLILPEFVGIDPEPRPWMFKLLYKNGKAGLTAIIKCIVDRSQRSAVSFHVPYHCSEEVFEYVVNRCPSLKQLHLPSWLVQKNLLLEAIGNWKNLEVLTLRTNHLLSEILTQVRLYCKKFVELNLLYLEFGDTEASAIVELMPKIKKLGMKYCRVLSRKSLMRVLEGCKDLEVLELSNCWDLVVDDQILKSGSHIKTFKIWSNRNQ